MELSLMMAVAITLSTALWYVASYLGELPSHDDNQRYQELRKLPDDGGFEVVRTFRYKRNAMSWVNQCHVKGCVIQLKDSKTGRVLLERKE